MGPPEKAVELHWELAPIEIDPSVGQEIPRRMAERDAVSSDPSESFGILTRSILRDALPSGRRAVNRGYDVEEMFIRLGFVLAPVFADIVDRFSRRAPLQDLRPERRNHQAGSVASVGIDEVVRHCEIDTVDAIRRPTEYARHQTSNIVDERRSPHLATPTRTGWARPTDRHPFLATRP